MIGEDLNTAELLAGLWKITEDYDPRNIKNNIIPPSRKGKKHSSISKEKMSIASKGKTWEERYGTEGATIRREMIQKRKEQRNENRTH